MKKNVSLLSFLVIMLLTSCSVASPAPVTLPAAYTPTLAATSTHAIPPTATLTPAPLPTSTLVLPLAIGTPLPQPGAIISPDTAEKIVEIADLGGQTIPIWALAFTPDGSILAAAGSENIVNLWDVSVTGEPDTFSGHATKVTSIAVSPDGKTLASGAEDNTIKLWDVASGQELRTLSTHHPDDSNSHGVLDMLFSPDGRMLVSVFESFSDSTSNFIFYMDLWDTASGKHMRTWNNYWLWGVAFSPDSKMLAWGTSNVYWKDNNVIVSDAASGRVVHTLSGHERRVNSVAFSPDGKTLASGSDDYTIKLWDVASGGDISTLSNDVTIIAVRSSDIAVPVTNVAFSPDGKTLVSGSQTEPDMLFNTITIWNVVNGQKLSSLGGYTGAVFSVAFSPDGEFIVSNSGDGIFRLWGVYP